MDTYSVVLLPAFLYSPYLTLFKMAIRPRFELISYQHSVHA